MKKFLKITLTLIVALALNFSLFTLSANAAASASISFSKKNVSVGDSVTVTVRVSQKQIYGVHLYINYNEEILTYVSGADGGAGALIIATSEGFTGKNSESFPIVFKAKKAGNCNISVSGAIGAGNPSELIQLKGASANLTVKDVTLSSNANLKSLSVSSGSLSPKFSPNVTDYKVNVGKSVTECKVYSTTSEADATVSVSGKSKLEIGENKRVITVTAPSGNTKKYTITIIRSNVDEEKLKSDLTAMVNGVTYAILKDISGITLPDGFNVVKRVYNGETISVATDKDENFELFYLKAENSPASPYTYDEDQNTFKKVNIITQMSKSYIIADIPKGDLPENYSSSLVEIGGYMVDCVINSNYKKMHYIYCFTEDGFNTYRYDSKYNVLQRSVEFKFNEQASSDSGSTDTSKVGFWTKFERFPKRVKIIVIFGIIGIVALITLIVLFIIKLISRSRIVNFDIEGYDEDFDTLEMDDNFNILNDRNQ